MGSHPGVATDQGIECTHRFRERVLRDERYKLFIDSNQRPEKLVDLSKDPEEQNDLKEQPEMAAVLDQLTAVAEGFPKQDNDPFYQRIPGYPSYPNRLNESVADPRKSQVHKIGRSD
jgi:arylsulfatase A-like enzyme